MQTSPDEARNIQQANKAPPSRKEKSLIFIWTSIMILAISNINQQKSENRTALPRWAAQAAPAIIMFMRTV